MTGGAHRRVVNSVRTHFPLHFWLQGFFPSAVGSLSAAKGKHGKHETVHRLLCTTWQQWLHWGMRRYIFALFPMFFSSCRFTGPRFQRVEHSQYQLFISSSYREIFGRSKVQVSALDDFLARLFTSIQHESMALKPLRIPGESFHMFSQKL